MIIRMQLVPLRIAAIFGLALAFGGCSRPAPSITRVADAASARIGVMTGTTGEMLAHKRFPAADIKHFDDIVDAIGALKARQLDAVLTGYPAALQSTKRNSDLTVLEEPLSDEDTSIGVRKGNSALLEQVDGILSTLKSNGTLADMKRRWLKKDLSPYEEVDIPLPATGTPLRVGVSATREPFTFVDARGFISGHDGELARRIAQRLGRPIEFQNMRFAALIPALQTNKIDIIITGMSATPERAKKIDFTQRYYELHNVLLVRSTALGAADRLSFGERIRESFDANLIREGRYLMLLSGLKTTAIVTVLSAILGTILGALICFMRTAENPVAQYSARAFIGLLRGTPVLVLLMLIFYVVFASFDVSPAIASILAFSLHFAAYSAEIFRAGLAALDRGQVEAALSLGFSSHRTFLHVTLPQLVKQVMPVYTGEFISLIKMTSIVGYIAVQDLTKAGDIIRSRTFDAFFPLVTVALLYFLLSGSFIFLLNRVQQRINSRPNRP
jgi:polar amino acid transport system substrate-binding protein